MMQITIHNCSDYSMQHFIQNELISIMNLYVRSHIDMRLLSNYNIDTTNFLKTILHRNIIRCRKIGSSYILDINPNTTLMDGDAKLIDICSLINYGNLSSPSYPIFTKMFEYIRKEFMVLYKYRRWR